MTATAPIERTPWSLRWLLATAALAAIAYEATSWWLVGHAGFPLDDSWIHAQFARNLAAGDGLAYNPGELVAGSTAPLWTALLAIGVLFPGGILVWAKLLGIGLYLGGVTLTYRLARELGSGRGLALLAAAWTLATYWLVWSALSGMEVPLFIVLSLAGMVAAIRERRDPSRAPISLALFAAGVLVRPEGALLLAVAVVDRLLVWRRDSATGELLLVRPQLRSLVYGLGIAALIVVPAALVYVSIGGSPLPTTFGSKAGSVRGLLPNAQYIYLVFGIFFRPLPFATLCVGAGALVLVARLGGSRDVGLLPALWLAALPVAYSMLSPQGKHLLVGNFGRYFFPLLPVVAVLGALGLERAARSLGESSSEPGEPTHSSLSRRAGWRLPLRGVAVSLLLAPTLITLMTGAARYAQNVANVEDSDVAMARWLAPRLDPRALIAVQDIGVFKFLLPNRVLDLSGIVSPDAQTFVRAATTPEDQFGQLGMVRFLEAHHPDFVIAFPAWYPALTASPLLHEIHRLAIPDNITVAGPELVVYATPWTRYPLRPIVPVAPSANAAEGADK